MRTLIKYAMYVVVAAAAYKVGESVGQHSEIMREFSEGTTWIDIKGREGGE